MNDDDEKVLGHKALAAQNPATAQAHARVEVQPAARKPRDGVAAYPGRAVGSNTMSDNTSFSITTEDQNWEITVLRSLANEQEITVFDPDTGALCTLRGADYHRVKNIWSAARRRLKQAGITARTLNQIVMGRDAVVPSSLYAPPMPPDENEEAA
jgi:hypothetical protein